MLLQNTAKPISCVKAHAADIISEIVDNRSTVVITQNGEAKAVLQDIGEYERIQESLALLKILALGRKDLEAGRVKTAVATFACVRERIKACRMR